jgi:hypothetical protein
VFVCHPTTTKDLRQQHTSNKVVEDISVRIELEHAKEMKNIFEKYVALVRCGLHQLTSKYISHCCEIRFIKKNFIVRNDSTYYGHAVKIFISRAKMSHFTCKAANVKKKKTYCSTSLSRSHE